MNLPKKQKQTPKATSIHTISFHLYQLLRRRDISGSVVEGYWGPSGVMDVVCILTRILLT